VCERERERERGEWEREEGGREGGKNGSMNNVLVDLTNIGICAKYFFVESRLQLPFPG